MKNKELKGYIILSLTFAVISSACASKPTTPATNATPAPLPKAPISSINPADLNIPGITDDPAPAAPAEEAPAEEGGEEEAPAEEGGEKPAETTPSTAASGAATPAPTATPADGTATPTPTATPADGTATPTPTATATPTPAPITCEAKIEGEFGLKIGEEKDLTGKITCSDGTSKDETNVKFTIADATIASINETTGVVKGLKAGTTKVYAENKTDSTMKTEISLTVNAVCSINFTPPTSLFTDSSANLVATVSCTGSADTTSDTSWSTSDASIASISSSGSVTGLKEGSVTITATYSKDANVKTEKAITIKKAPDAKGNDHRTDLAVGKLYQPRGIDVRNGRIYVADYDAGNGVFNNAEGELQIFDTSGNQIRVIQGSTGDSLPYEVSGIVSDGARVWIANRIPYAQSANNVYSFTVDGTGRTNSRVGATGQNGSIVKDMAIDPSSGNIYVADQAVRSISRYTYTADGKLTTPTSGAPALYFGGGNRIPEGVCVDDSGNVLFTDSSTTPPVIRKYSKSGQELTNFIINSTGNNSAGPVATKLGDLAYDPRNGGMLYVLAAVNGSNVILRYDWQGNFVRKFGEGTMTDPRNIAIGSDGSIYVTDYAKNAIVNFAPGL
jgi:hypothetical protein